MQEFRKFSNSCIKSILIVCVYLLDFIKCFTLFIINYNSNLIDIFNQIVSSYFSTIHIFSLDTFTSQHIPLTRSSALCNCNFNFLLIWKNKMIFSSQNSVFIRNANLFKNIKTVDSISICIKIPFSNSNEISLWMSWFLCIRTLTLIFDSASV